MSAPLYAGPVVDAHHHFWDLERNYLPWLADEPMIPFRYGDYRAIRRTYMPPDYARDYAGLDVVRSVYVETEWDRADPVGETRWVETVRAECGFPHAMVAQAWLDRDDIADVLAAQAAFSFVRGIRHKPRGAARPDLVKSGVAGSMGDDQWRRGYELLGVNGLSFELQTVPWHLAEGASLATDFPDIPIILNHTGVPLDRSESGLAMWREGMALLAERPNVAVKISGLGVAGAEWPADANRSLIRETIATFGPDRCMFASNYPVDSLCADFATIYGAFSEATIELPANERAKLFHDNAIRYYRLD